MVPNTPPRRVYPRRRRGLRPDTEPSISRALSPYSWKAYENDEDDANLSEDEPRDSDQDREPEEYSDSNDSDRPEGPDKSENQSGSNIEEESNEKDWREAEEFELSFLSHSGIQPFVDEPESSSNHWNQRDSKANQATSLSSARQKNSTYLQTTISDDRSRGSEYDVSKRRLVALHRSVADKKTQPQEIGAESHSNANPKEASLNDTPTPLKDTPAPETTDSTTGAATDAIEADAMDYEPLNKPSVYEDSSLSNALRIVRRALDIQDQSLLTIETLREFASKTKVVEPRVQLIHRVSRNGGKNMYLDPPQWLAGATYSREALVGNLPIHNVSSYLSNHSEIVCVVYRDYDGSHRGVKDSDDGSLDADSPPEHSSEVIELISEGITTAVEAFCDYFEFHVGNATSTKVAVLSSPYLPIFHVRGDALNSFLETLNGTQRQKFQLLVDYILTEHEAEYELVDDMTSKGKITYKYIKYLFKPGDVVVQGSHQGSRGYLCTAWLEGGNLGVPESDLQIYLLRVWCWKFDGVFSQEKSTLTVSIDIKGPPDKVIDDMDIRPLAYVNNLTQERLRRRGAWFWKCRVRHMVSYHEENERGFQDSGHGRYMIDMKMYRELHKPKEGSIRESKGDLEPEALKQNDPPDDEFIYLTPLTIKGYNLKRKNNQIEAENSTDLITGKGNGLIMLLHGGPGTGKTLTAESVAETAERPLYPVTCGDIGTEPEEVENYLESVLHVGKTWGCVVLLDEADVFLEQRSLEDLRRNALVSVFLRVLEYYDGILVLTSNRVGTFDEAFKSRIQLALHYKNLTEHQRTKIWGNFISRLEEINESGIDFDELKDNIEELSKYKLNGREIRNVITTARQYARWERQQPSRQHIQLDYKMMKEVVETAGEFDRYIQKLNHGYTSDQLAEGDGLRLGDDG
ncbi:hypothetical protein E0Z10_g1564 [Xylaria hypoxylon]|uniref:AAA+ ATPase domain-containing protein n=1 Tax=Xylaria hypoxylon TaxID=37992 RepID=A0A4Z0Z8I4_9PEZI|nr:hypothetical protein E0Z10_g1564 [Xylaria hypoxylon]